MTQIRISGDSYLDGGDLSCGPGGAVRVAAASHADRSRVAVWRVDAGEPALEWVSGHEDGLVAARIVHQASGAPLVLAWCVRPRDSCVVVLGPGRSRVVLEGLAEPSPVALPGGEVVALARSGEMVVLVDALDPGGRARFVSEPGGRVFSPSLAPGGDGGLVAAWEQERPPGCAIMGRRLWPGAGAGPVLRLDGDVTAHVPCVATHPGRGALVAWHAPAPFDDPQLLVKDPRLVLLAGDEVMHPVGGHAPPPGEEPRGEEQGFEFPVPVSRADGSVHVLGRGSHSFARRILDDRGWGPAERIDEPGWGCRGPWIRAAVDESDRVWCLTRERGGLVVRLPGESPAGEATFASRTVRCTGPGPEILAGGREVERDRDGLATWFGDIHQHSAFSDGTGAPHEAYVRALHFYGDDVVALSDHESFLGKRTPPGEWRYLMDLAWRFDDPGRLATLIAYEWTGRMLPGPGHKVVYYPGPAPLVSRDDDGRSKGRGLLDGVALVGGIAVPHHVGWTGADEDAHGPDLQPCFEIVSCHGAYERRDGGPIGHREPSEGPFILELLERGLRFGLVGGSDGHGLLWHHGVSRRRDSHRTGLTAVISERLDRASVMQALAARSVYATSGVRMWLRLWVEGEPMGSALRAGGGAVRAEVQVRAGGRVARASLVHAGGEQVLEADGDAVRWEGDVNVGQARPSFLYLRVERTDGECSWSSPVFLD